MKCVDHTSDLGQRIRAPGEACDVPDCGRFVASVDEHVSVGGIVCRVTTTGTTEPLTLRAGREVAR